jgi:glucose/arabinose dehydrogenase
MTVGAPEADRLKAQDPSSHRGKILRLREDGTAPPDNPFIGKYRFGLRFQPEIFSLGHRNAMGLVINPETGELWENENGPLVPLLGESTITHQYRPGAQYALSEYRGRLHTDPHGRHRLFGTA